MFIILVITFFIVSFCYFLLPVVESVAISSAVNQATNDINSTVASYLKNNTIMYDTVAKITTDTSSQVSSIQINSNVLNQIKTGVTANIASMFSQLKSLQLKIPLTAIFGSAPFSGIGSGIPLYISYTVTAQSNIENIFITRGINQTQHRIMLCVEAEVEVFLYGKSKTIPLQTQITIAETIIVGNIPDIYAGAEDELWPNLIN